MSTATHTIRERFGAEASNWNALYAQDRATTIYEHNLHARRSTALAFLSDVQGRILDVGCGPANVTLDLPDGTDITATDFALPMLAAARDKARAAHRAINLSASDATALPFKSASHEAVLALGLLEYVPQPERVLSECARILVPGGTLVFSIPNRRSPFIRVDDAIKRAKNLVTRDLLPTAVRSAIKSALGKDDPDYFTHKRHRFDPAAVLADLADLGFVVEDSRYHTFGFGVAERSELNLKLCTKLETMADTHPRLERLGWTLVLKAKKLC